jgi:hypothetical protein
MLHHFEAWLAVATFNPFILFLNDPLKNFMKMSENKHFKLKLMKGFFNVLRREISGRIMNKGIYVLNLKSS